jgi:hypothetical protein
VDLISRFKILMGDFGAKGNLWSGYDQANGVFEQAHAGVDRYLHSRFQFGKCDSRRPHSRMAARIIAVLDVTDILAPTASVISAYSWPLCDDIRDDPVARRCTGTAFTYDRRDTIQARFVPRAGLVQNAERHDVGGIYTGLAVDIGTTRTTVLAPTYATSTLLAALSLPTRGTIMLVLSAIPFGLKIARKVASDPNLKTPAELGFLSIIVPTLTLFTLIKIF